MHGKYTKKLRLCSFLLVFGMMFLASGAALADGRGVVRINSPVYDSNHVSGDNIYFACSVKDSAGADVQGVELVWLSNLDGRLGTGSRVTTNKLSMGIHLITVNASDGAGTAIGTDAIKIKVSYVNQNRESDSSGVVDIGETGGEGYVVNPMF